MTKCQKISMETKYGKLSLETFNDEVRITDSCGNYAGVVEVENVEEFVARLQESCERDNLSDFLNLIFKDNWVIAIVKERWRHIGDAIGALDEESVARHNLVNTIGNRYILRNK